MSDYVVYRGICTHADILDHVVLNETASKLDDRYYLMWLAIVSGKGLGQIRVISKYDAQSRKAYINYYWKIAPDTASELIILWIGEL